MLYLLVVLNRLSRKIVSAKFCPVSIGQLGGIVSKISNISISYHGDGWRLSC